MNGCRVCGKPTKESDRIYCSYKCSNSRPKKAIPDYILDPGLGPIADKCRKAREMRVSGRSRGEIAKALNCGDTILRKYLDPDYVPKPKVEKVEISCSTCGAELLRYPKQIYKDNYCSQECISKKLEVDGKRIPKVCVVCGTSFHVSRSAVKEIKGRGEYCSNRCKYIAHAPRPRICIVCKRAFIATRTNHNAKYCSKTCMRIAHTNFAAPFEGDCEYCGSPFKRRFYSNGDSPRFCSKSCVTAAMWATGNPPHPSGDEHPNWHGGKKENENGKLRRMTPYKKWRESVLARDNRTCQDCGTMQKKGLAAHHVFPFADFPEHQYELWNGITLCRSCHMKTHGYELEHR